MAKRPVNNFTPEWFESRGYTKNSTGGYDPPKFINPLNKIPISKFKNSTEPDIIPNKYNRPIIGEFVNKFHPILISSEFTINKPLESVSKTIWTTEDIVLLKLFYEQKRDINFISEKLGKDNKSIKSKAYSLKITNNPDYTYLEKETIIYYYEEVSKNNFNFLEKLSELLNRPKENISRFARKLGLTSYGRKITKIKECKVCGAEMSLTGYQNTNRSVCSKECISKLSSKNVIKRLTENGHPKGMLCKNHTDENKTNQSKIAIKNWENFTEQERSDLILKRQKTKEKNGTLITPRLKTKWKQGWRNIGGYDKYYRSKWEANYARYLEFLKQNNEIKNWFHEPKTFWFEDVLRGCRSYLPDFLIINKDNSEEYHEVKGWMDDKSKTKLSRMTKYYPSVKIKVIQEDWFKENNIKLRPIIKEWE